MPANDTVEKIQAALAAPFPAEAVRWKPKQITEDKKQALAVPYITAKEVMDRLGEVLGVGGWQTRYRELPDGVVCSLRVKILGEWIEHEDAGGCSSQEDVGDRLKAGFSDALKRVAVRVGIGRYLSQVRGQWVPWDKAKKQFVTPPTLPGDSPPPTPPPPPANAKPAAAATTAAANPVASVEALTALLATKGKAWPDAVKWINAKYSAKYSENAKWVSISLHQRKALVEALGKMPNAGGKS